jgi:hypothetical protein
VDGEEHVKGRVVPSQPAGSDEGTVAASVLTCPIEAADGSTVVAMPHDMVTTVTTSSAAAAVPKTTAMT